MSTTTLLLLCLCPVLAVALAFRPWRMLRHAPLQHPWLAAMAVLPWAWSTPGLPLPGALAGPLGSHVVQVSGACLLVLMVGWPLAVVSLVPVALLGGWLAGRPLDQMLALLLWHGLAPATVALAIGWATRRWLPPHLFVYILARAFAGTAVAITACGALQTLLTETPPGLSAADLVMGHLLMGWGEAITTGMLVATMVAFRPLTLATYSDRLYLPHS